MLANLHDFQAAETGAATTYIFGAIAGGLALMWFMNRDKGGSSLRGLSGIYPRRGKRCVRYKRTSGGLRCARYGR